MGIDEKGVWRTVRGRRVFIVDGQMYFGGPEEYARKNPKFVRDSNGKIVRVWLTDGQKDDTIETEAGKSKDGSTVIGIGRVSPAELNREISSFGKKYAYADHEYAEVIATDGRTFLIEGTEKGVCTSLAGKSALYRATVIHNHPVWAEYGHGDAFSIEDFTFAAVHQTAAEYLVTGNRQYYFRLKKQLSEDEAREMYKTALFAARDRCWRMDLTTDFWQLETMRILSETAECVEFYETDKKNL